MSKKVGIPRGLFYYQYFPLWKTFFEELGAEIIISGQTSKRILDEGVKTCVDEACLPVKVYHGHLASLKDKVDYLFIPRFTSISRNEYVCPKFGGLPDMVKSTFRDLPTVIDTEINLRKSKRNAYKAAYEIGSYLSKDKTRIRRAYKKALAAYRGYREQVKGGKLPSDILGSRKTVSCGYSGKKLNVAVIGHVYNLYDSYTNMNLLDKLKEYGVNIITMDMFDEKSLAERTAVLHKRMFWNFGTKAMGSIFCILDRKDIDGIIYLMSFGCGVDSFVCDLAERQIRRNRDIPFTVLTIDEHSGEAGMNTRIEAFIDMIRWRNKDDHNLSPYGQYLCLR
jgi:predicted nucleotide-binding protein (sugar kinase/HSP70/actin superfamily)